MIAITALAVLLAGTNMRATHLRCEYLENPLAIEAAHPRFSWWVNSKQSAAHQRAYEIEVRRGHETAWNSGRVDSDQSTQIPYAGAALRSRDALRWRVRLWANGAEPGEWSKWAEFRAGLWDSADWSSNWIESPTAVEPYVGAHNGYHSEITHNAADEKWVELISEKDVPFDSVTLYPAQPYDWEPSTYGLMFPLRFRIEVDGKTVLDHTTSDMPMPTSPVTLKFSAVKGKSIRLVSTLLRARDGDNYGLALAEMEASGSGETLKGLAPAAKDGLQNESWSIKNLANGDKVSHKATNIDSIPPVRFEKTFSAKPKLAEATLYATALGAYEVTLNGKRVGDHILAPEWTDYHTRVQYQAYDVTKMVRDGKNEISALLGDGWYAGRLGMAQAFTPQHLPRAVYGRTTAFRAQLELTYTDGSRSIVGTDGTWTAQTDPILSSDLLDGEHQDWTQKPRSLGNAKRAEVSPKLKLNAQVNEPIRITTTCKPQSITEPKPGVYVVDFGQNMVGWVQLRMEGKAGQNVTLHHAEMLNEDGTVYTANLRGAPQVDRYTLDGKERWYHPHFTYHGFRYLQLDGLTKAPKKSDLIGEVFHSSSPETAMIETSNPMVNRLWQNVVWTQRANLMSVPTDCPQRDERLGWMGDILAFGQTAATIMDMGGFNSKWLRDVRDAQAEDGRYPDIAPHPYGKDIRFTGVPGWGDAGVGVPFVQWHNYRDRDLLKDHLDSMKQWITWIESKNPNHLWEKDRHNDYGDWLNGDTLIRDGWPRTGGECPKEVFATMMWYQSADQVAKMATAIGDTSVAQEARTMADAIKAAFVSSYVDADAVIRGDTQAGYSIALGIGILPNELQDKAFAHLVAAIHKYNDHLSTGFHSTHHMMNVLADRGQAELAYKLLLNDTFPSWGYGIANGATTIWERWDGYVKGRGFQDPGMNSFNHWALGAVGEWMMQRMVGIRPGTEGWQHFTIQPVPDKRLEFAKGHYDSPYGRISVSWKFEKGDWTAKIEVPANTYATLILPAAGMLDGGSRAGASFDLQSGSHTVVVSGLGH